IGVCMYKKIIMTAVAATIGLAGVAYASQGAYIQAQGGIGGMDTKKYSANDNPYSSISLRDGVSYRISGGYLWSQDNTFSYGAEIGYAGYPKNIYKSDWLSAKETYSGHYYDVLGVGKYNFTADG